MKQRYLIFLGAIFFSLLSFAQEKEYPQLSNLATLYIETENGVTIPDKNSDYVRAVLRLVEDGKITVYDALGMRGRGNSTWNLDKKPYRIKFDSKQTFLGSDRANAKSWTLLANHSDKTLMRNAVASFIGTFAGQPFTAAAKFVDVVLNGEFLGNYQISDHMEIRKKRVNITEQEEGLDASQNISGGYFLEVDGFAYQEKSYFTTSKGLTITIKSPDEDVISKDQTAYIRDYINSFESALFSPNFKDPNTGYRRFVDESTLASWYLSSELTANVDCFWSTYIYKDKDDPKIYWGPLWDFDIAFNNCNRAGHVTQSLMSDVAFGADLTKIWVKQMWQDPWFVNLIYDKWMEMVNAGIEQAVLDYIDETAALLEESQKLNYEKWRIDKRYYDEYILFSTYSEGVDFLKQFIRERVAFLTAALGNARDAVTPAAPFSPDVDFYYTISSKAVGSFADFDSNSAICIRKGDVNNHNQHWQFVPDETGSYYMIINCDQNLAVAEMSQLSGSQYTLGTQLGLVTPDITDPRQLWEIYPASNTAGTGMIIKNSLTGYAWNNSGGSTADENPIISWTSDSEDPNKPNRQWYMRPVHAYEEGEDTTGVKELEEQEPQYYVTYDKKNDLLHFRVKDGKDLEGTASILSLDGKLMMQFKPTEDIDLSSLSSGYYILSWEINGKNRSLKFMK